MSSRQILTPAAIQDDGSQNKAVCRLWALVHVRCCLLIYLSCHRQFAKYICPSCNVPYCSLVCFRSSVCIAPVFYLFDTIMHLVPLPMLRNILQKWTTVRHCYDPLAHSGRTQADDGVTEKVWGGCCSWWRHWVQGSFRNRRGKFLSRQIHWTWSR